MLVDTKMADRAMGLAEPYRVTRNGRRYFSAAHKRAVVQKCLVPGTSLAAVALSCGFNANLVRRWVRQYQERSPSTKLVPVVIAPEIQSSKMKTRIVSTARIATVKPKTASSSLELQIGEARLVLRGMDLEQLRVVLDTLLCAR
jgi:transposase